MEKFEKGMDISLDKDSDKKEIDIVEDDSFVVKSWKANTCWKWNIKIDNCPICREHLQEPCIECIGNASFSGVGEYTIARGGCNHTFHYHCINRWLKQRQVCPLCNQEWTYEGYGD